MGSGAFEGKECNLTFEGKAKCIGLGHELGVFEQHRRECPATLTNVGRRLGGEMGRDEFVVSGDASMVDGPGATELEN
jgi:hypothetical protein